MLTVYSKNHYLHQPEGEIHGGRMVTPFECPKRMEFVLEQLSATGFEETIAPDSFGEAPLEQVHTRDYLEFLKTAWEQWTEAGMDYQILPTVWPVRRQQLRVPSHIDGKVGYYALAGETAMVKGTWGAAFSSAEVALTAAVQIQNGRRSAFGLCRPPGHHATKDMYGGYCFLNNAAIAAQHFLDKGAERVAVLDPDFHHGNGTQDIFYDRADVFFLSLHGEPENAFPHFLGYADETGEGKGKGFNANYPMPPGTGFSIWGEALAHAIQRITHYGPDVLIISLGVDTYEKDPISFFKLTQDDFKTYGGMIGALGIPTLFIMEGGYAVEDVGINVVNVLLGFEDQG